MAVIKIQEIIVKEGESVSVSVDDRENEVLVEGVGRSLDYEGKGYHRVEDILLVMNGKTRIMFVMRKQG